MRRRTAPVVGVIALALLIYGAVFYYNHQRLLQHDSACLGSFYEFAYTAPAKEAPPRARSLPGAGWQLEAPLPFVPDDYILVGLEATRLVDGELEVWVKKKTYSANSKPTIHEYLVYHAGTKTWTRIPAQVDEPGTYVEKLLVAPDGSLWGQNASGRFTEPAAKPVLSKYDEEQQIFQPDQNSIYIPAGWKDMEGGYPWSRVLMDGQGTFWIVAKQTAIFSYDPATLQTRRWIDIPDLTAAMVVLGPDQNLYITKQQDWMHSSVQAGELWKFDTRTGKLNNLGAPLGRWPIYTGIAAGADGRLFLGAVGWRNARGGWQRMYPYPFVYFWQTEWEVDYRWATPELVLESSDGRLWFRKQLDDGVDRGMAWVDPDTMQGCWFTTVYSNVVEDPRHNLWLVAREGLYRYALESGK